MYMNLICIYMNLRTLTSGGYTFILFFSFGVERECKGVWDIAESYPNASFQDQNTSPSYQECCSLTAYAECLSRHCLQVHVSCLAKFKPLPGVRQHSMTGYFAAQMHVPFDSILDSSEGPYWSQSSPRDCCSLCSNYNCFAT